MSEATVTDFEKGGRPGKGSAPFPATILNLDQSLSCDSARLRHLNCVLAVRRQFLARHWHSKISSPSGPSPDFSALTNPAHHSVPFTKDSFSEDT